MPAVIPQRVATTPFHEHLCQAGLLRVHQGKVRDTYALPDPSLLLVVASNRASIFDFVLPELVPHKGELLTAITVFWLDEVLGGINHHLVAFGNKIDAYLPLSLRGFSELQRCALVVHKLSMIPVECIVRGYLTGSGWKSYRTTQQVCGITLAPGLYDGARIEPAPIFTPTTKAQAGHDVHLPAEAVAQQYGAWLSEHSLGVYRILAAVAEHHDLLFADTKFEFGEGGVLADEVGTPDSSRLWDSREWVAAAVQRRSPRPLDKQILRDWGSKVEMPVEGEQGTRISLPNLDPENPDHLHFVASLTVPAEVVQETSQLYRIVLQRLTGLTLEEFQQQKLGVG